MSSRSWFFAADGKQYGPYPEAEFRGYIASGTVRPDTLVWTEGMANWQRASEIPGLLGAGEAVPAPIPPRDVTAPGSTAGGQTLAFEPSIWALLGYSLLFSIGFALVVPAPWTATAVYRWMVEQLRVPQRPALGFTGQPKDIWYVFVALALTGYVGLLDNSYLYIGLLFVQAFLSWMTVRWVAANISSGGEHLPVTFNGSPWGYVGWYLLLNVSFISIIGWAWVIPAWTRWLCRNVEGTRREIVFTGSGLQVLWRTLVFVFGCVFILPIPWVLGWYARWYVGQFMLVPRGQAV